MAETDQPKAERRIHPDKDEEFCKQAEAVVKLWLRARGVHDDLLIEDVSQATLEVLKKYEKLSWDVANRTYVKTIARRMLYKFWKEEGGYIPLADMPVEFQDAQHIHRHPLRPSEQEVDSILRQERERLSEKDDTTFMLMAEGKHYGYSKKSGINDEAARQRRSRLKRRLGTAIPKQRGKGKNQRT